MNSQESVLAKEILNDIGRYRRGQLAFARLRPKLDMCAGACGAVGPKWILSFREARSHLPQAVTIPEPMAVSLEDHLVILERLLQAVT